MNSNKIKICLVIPGLSPGGAERVISVLANEFSKHENIDVHLCLYVKPNIFYELNDQVIIHKISFDYKKLPRVIFTIKILLSLRKKFKEIQPHSLLSFGGKYNSFVLLASFGLGIKTYVSDRSRPGKSYGKILDVLNPLVYRMSSGIIAQTQKAKLIAHNQTKHESIFVIGNPIPNIYNPAIQKEKIIINVGRFIKTKQQELLIDMFHQINPSDWQLWFFGEGEYLLPCKEKVRALGLENRIKFFGNQSDIVNYYQKASIFAFTSISEGFPNALGEAMSAGCACISFDCNAGPSDLIEDDINGFLIPDMNREKYVEKLTLLMQDANLRAKFRENAIQKVKIFEEKSVAEKFINMLNC